MVFYLLCLVFSYFLFCIGPYIIPKIFNDDHETVVINVFYLFAAIITLVSTAVIRYPNNYILQSIRKYSREILWDDLNRKGYIYCTNKPIGKVQSYISEITNCAKNIQANGMQFLIKSFVMLTTYTILVCKMDYVVGLVYLVTYIFFFVASYFLAVRHRTSIPQVIEEASKVNEYFVDYFNNADTIYSSQSNNKEKALLNKTLNHEYKAFYALQFKIDISYSIQTIILVTISILQIYLLLRTSNRALSISYYLILIYSIFSFENFGSQFLNLNELIDRLKEGLKAIEYNQPNDASNQRNISANADDVAISIHHLTVCYDDHTIINHFSTEIQNGEKIALIGPNGSGKSTLLKTIAGMIPFEQGSISLNSNEIMYVSQTTNLFNRSIYDNLIYPLEKQNVNTALLWKLIKQLELDTVISSDEALFSKMTGDFGRKLSGGERQKILLIRTVLNHPSIVLFDEITASLDKKSIDTFFTIIDEYLSDSTIVFVTHKTLSNEIFNRIISMD